MPKKKILIKSHGNYHRIDCPYLADGDVNAMYISFKSKEVKYDKIYDAAKEEHQYDHKNLSCYTCINKNNYNTLFKPKNDNWYKDNDKKYTSYYDRISSMLENDYKNRRILAYISLAKERQNIYKMNALPASEGYQVKTMGTLSTSDGAWNQPISGPSLELLKKLQITIKLEKNEPNIPNAATKQTIKLKISVNGTEVATESISNQLGKEQTITVDLLNQTNGNLDNIKIEWSDSVQNYTMQYKVQSIKEIYN